jgi:hypothetical protein
MLKKRKPRKRLKLKLWLMKKLAFKRRKNENA